MTQPEVSEKNINVETVEDCNLLCKLIIDYLDTEECIIEKEGTNSFRIAYPEGSFINYKDTSYELTYAYFCYPSRHSIDGQKYDLEVNLYHGNFNNKGIVAHTHYHMDTEESNQHKHFHYHLGSDADADNTPHIDADSDNENLDKKNIVTCMLFNKGQHTGSDVNKFFNQFVHHKSFKNLLNVVDAAAAADTTLTKEIPVHDHWSIERILPKKRSFFMYEDTNTYIVFDTVQTISKEIIDRLYIRGIKGTAGDIHDKDNYNPTTPSRVLYRKNIEIITDPAYKKSKRIQIKDLLSLTRMSSYIPSTKTSKEYNDFSDGIINSFMGGVNTGYLTDEAKAKRVADLWDEYGQDNHIKVSWKEMKKDDYKKIILNTDAAIEEKYLEKLLETFKTIGTTNTDFDEQNSFEYYFNKDNLDEYIKDKKEVNNYLKEYYKKIISIENKANYFNDKSLFDFYDIVYDYPEEEYDGPTVNRLARRDKLRPYGEKLDNFYNCIIGKGCVVTNKRKWNRDLGKTRKDIGDFEEKINNLNLDKILKDGLPNNNLFKLCIRASKCDDPVSATQKIYRKKMRLRFLFEDLDIIWQTKNDCKSSFYSLIHEYNKNNGPDNNKTRDDLKTLFDEEEFTTLKGKIIFQIAGEQLSRTINNEECQNWLSNETHYEGNLWKFWETPEQMDKTGSIFSNLTSTLKEKIGEGMLSYEDTTDADTVTTWSSHNYCRNPGNRSAAPWCYTKNPNKRWEYCQTPYYSNILGKVVLFLVLLFIVIIAFFTVKTLFFNEYPMQFVAKLTGGILASKDTFSGTNPKPVPPK